MLTIFLFGKTNCDKIGIVKDIIDVIIISRNKNRKENS